MKTLTILLFCLSFNVYAMRDFNAERYDENGLLVDPPRVCAHIKNGSLKAARFYLPDYELPVEQALFKLRCDGKDMMEMAISGMLDHHSEFFRKGISDYFIKELSSPEQYSEYLLKGIGGCDIFNRINELLGEVDEKEGKMALEMRMEFIEYLTKYPVPGSAELLAKQLSVDIEK